MIWRRVPVPETMSQHELHGVLQVAMGWEAIHLFQFIDLGVSKSAIARITGVSRQTLYHFIRTRGITPGR